MDNVGGLNVGSRVRHRVFKDRLGVVQAWKRKKRSVLMVEVQWDIGVTTEVHPTDVMVLDAGNGHEVSAQV